MCCTWCEYCSRPPMKTSDRTTATNKRTDTRKRTDGQTVSGSTSPTHVFRSPTARRVWPSVRAAGFLGTVERRKTTIRKLISYNGARETIPPRRRQCRWRFVTTETWFTGWVFVELGIRTSAARRTSRNSTFQSSTACDSGRITERRRVPTGCQGKI